MPESVDSVKAVATFLRGAADRSADAERRTTFYGYVESLEWAVAELVRLKGLTSALPPDLGNIYDLPQELLDELSVAKVDDLEDQLVTVINSYGGEASLDQILVGIFRKFGFVQKRRFIQNKLYRMEMIWSVDGKKGYYTTTKPVEPSPNNWDDAPPEPRKPATRDDMDDAIPF